MTHRLRLRRNIHIRLIRLPHFIRRGISLSPALLAGIAALVLVGGSAAALTTNDTLRTALVAKVSNVIGNNTEPKEAPGNSAKKPAPTPSPSKAAKSSKKQSTSTTSPGIKYSVSADPRSTAYSLTPYVNPASFDYRVTHASQFAAGTQIAYNASKGDKKYYNGDLIVSPATVTVHLSDQNPISEVFTLATPDNKPVTYPAAPWYDTTQVAFANYWPGDGYTSVPLSLVSWPMRLNLYNGFSTPGTYHLQLEAFGTPTNTEEFQYDGFVTLNVVKD